VYTKNGCLAQPYPFFLIKVSPWVNSLIKIWLSTRPRAELVALLELCSDDGSLPLDAVELTASLKAMLRYHDETLRAALAHCRFYSMNLE
jgi:hypothetical protein